MGGPASGPAGAIIGPCRGFLTARLTARENSALSAFTRGNAVGFMRLHASNRSILGNPGKSAEFYSKSKPESCNNYRRIFCEPHGENNYFEKIPGFLLTLLLSRVSNNQRERNLTKISRIVSTETPILNPFIVRDRNARITKRRAKRTGSGVNR